MTPPDPIPPAMPYRYCGRSFTDAELAQIRRIIAAPENPHRLEISRQVCRQLHWLRPDGRLKDMSCRVALLKMHRDQVIQLPPPRKRNGNGRIRVRFTPASQERPPVAGDLASLHSLRLEPVFNSSQSRLWNELIARYHYLGYTPLPGAQYRYLIYSGHDLLGAIGFGAAAWKMAPRDRWIGWNSSTREANLRYITNNNRFLILPWVKVKNLASKILAMVARRISFDWQQRYGYPLVLLETLVETERFRGSCYRAANWLCVGQTQGRGKLDRRHEHRLPVKDIYLYPLLQNPSVFLCDSDSHVRQ